MFSLLTSVGRIHFWSFLLNIGIPCGATVVLRVNPSYIVIRDSYNFILLFIFTVTFTSALNSLSGSYSYLVLHYRLVPSAAQGSRAVMISNVHPSRQTGESTGDRPAFSGFGSSSSYNSSKVTGSRITTVTLLIELI